jgi:putative transposase
MVYTEYMKVVNRRWTIRLYPSKQQRLAMLELLYRHAELYNAALEHRIGAWKRCRHGVSHYDQANLLKEVKQARPEYAAINHDSLSATLKRLDLAFQAFFRRAKAGHTPGYPRFKSAKRFPGWEYLAHGKGNRLYPTEAMQDSVPIWRNGHLYLQHVGKMRFTGRTGNPGKVKVVTIRHQAGRWYASVVVQCLPHREHGERVAGLDWGVNALATLAYGPGEYAEVENDRLFRAQQAQAAQAARDASKSLRGKRSNTAQKKHLRVARLHQRLANQRKDRSHKRSAQLVKEHGLIVTEELKIANMTRSSRGTVEKPGKMVAQKAGLNREILDTAPGTLMQMLRYKAEEAGCELLFINTRKHKPSQTCPMCSGVRKKTLAERLHACSCGFSATRDQAAALLMLRVGLECRGQKLAWGLPPKTPSRAA